MPETAKSKAIQDFYSLFRTDSINEEYSYPLPGAVNRKSLSDAQEAHYTDELVEKIVKNVRHLVKHLRDNGGK